MYCPYCGHPNTDEPASCIACGSSLLDDDPPAPTHAGPSWDILGITPRLVGRKEERKALHEALSESIKTRQVVVVTLSGPVGMGKSRLVAEFAAEAQGQLPPSRVYFGRSAEGAQAPYQPFIEILRERFSVGDLSEDFDAIRRALLSGVSELFPEDKGAPIAHLLAYLLGVPFPESAVIAALKATPERLLSRAQSALKRFLEADAGQTPLVLVLEDLHHAPKETIELLSYLASNLGSVPITFILTTEPSLFSTYPDWGKGDYLHRQIDLLPLSDEEIAAMLRELLAKAPSIPEELVRVACERAQGNPFSLVELVWTFLDAGVLEVKGEEWKIDKDRLGSLDIPRTIEGVLEARLRRLSADERRVLERAALVGQPFWRDAVLALLRAEAGEASGADLPPKRSFGGDDIEQFLDTQLEALVQKDLITRAPVSTFTGQTEYRLRHLMIRELLRAKIAPELSRKLHRLAGQWLEVVAGEKRAEHLETIAEHRERAGDMERAAVAYAKAGEAAMSRYSMRTAISYYERALQILPQDEFAFRLEILHNLGSALSHVGENDRAIGVFENMLACAYTLANRSKAGVALNKIGRAERDRGNYREAIEALNRSLSLFRAVGDTRGVASDLDVIGSVHFRMGNYEAALRHVTDSLALRRALGDQRSIALSLSDLGNIQQNMGFLDEAERSHREALETRRRIGDREGTASSLNNLALLVYDRGEISEAVKLLEEALSIAQEIGHRFVEVTTRANLGELLRETGDIDGAEGHLLAALSNLREAHDLRLETEVCRNLAGVFLLRGDLEGARKQAGRAFELARSLGSKSSMALALRTLGEIASHVPVESPERARADAEAREYFERTLEIFEEMGNEVERARALAIYAEFLKERNKLDRARKILGEARDLFAKLGMPKELQRAEEKLAALPS